MTRVRRLWWLLDGFLGWSALIFVVVGLAIMPGIFLMILLTLYEYWQRFKLPSKMDLRFKRSVNPATNRLDMRFDPLAVDEGCCCPAGDVFVQAFNKHGN